MPVMQKVPYYNNLRKLNLSSISRCWAIVTDAKKTMIILFEETNLFINFRATSSGRVVHCHILEKRCQFHLFRVVRCHILEKRCQFHLFRVVHCHILEKRICWNQSLSMIILFEETNLFINFRATSSGSNCSNNIYTTTDFNKYVSPVYETDIHTFSVYMCVMTQGIVEWIDPLFQL
jgi:hypothetical protein